MQLVEGAWVSGSFFDTIGVPRLSSASNPAVRRSQRLRRSRHRAQLRLLATPLRQRRERDGGTLFVDGRQLTVLGVTPPGFTGIEVGRSFDVAAPLCAEPLLDGKRDPATRATSSVLHRDRAPRAWRVHRTGQRAARGAVAVDLRDDSSRDVRRGGSPRLSPPDAQRDSGWNGASRRCETTMSSRSGCCSVSRRWCCSSPARTWRT